MFVHDDPTSWRLSDKAEWETPAALLETPSSVRTRKSVEAASIDLEKPHAHVERKRKDLSRKQVDVLGNTRRSDHVTWRRLAVRRWGISAVMLMIVAGTYYTSDVRHAYEVSEQIGLSTFSIPPLLWLSLLIYAILNVGPAAVVYCVAVVLVEEVRSSLVVPILLGVAILSSAVWWILLAKFGVSWRGRHRN